MYVNQDGIKYKENRTVCTDCKYNCKLGGSSYCIKKHHFLTVNTSPQNNCNEFNKRGLIRHRVIVI